MKKYDLAVLTFLALAINLFLSQFIQAPGYMDADYSFAAGKAIVNGKGFTEPFLWNYLDSPGGVVHPAFTYWMPLSSLLAALGIMITGKAGFEEARFPFLILASSVPLVTTILAWKLTHSRIETLIAGGLAILSGFYLPGMLTTETFSPMMLLGGFFFLMMQNLSNKNGNARAVIINFVVGVVVGFMHLARADGIVWLGFALLTVLLIDRDSSHLSARLGNKYWSLLFRLALVTAGYTIVMLPWYGRNITIFGSIFPPGSSKTLWLTNYDQIFSFHVEGLNPLSWLASGLGSILSARLDAFVANIKTLVGVQGLVVLFPLAIAGGWSLRKDARIKLGAAGWLVTFFLMTIIFPFPGARGGFLHSSAAFQPLVWTLAAAGLGVFIDLGVRLRNWNQSRSEPVFGGLLLFVCGVVTAILFQQRVVGSLSGELKWQASWDRYSAVERLLISKGAAEKDIVVVNNPPGFFATVGRSAVVIPDGDVKTLKEAANRYGARYLILDENNSKRLSSLLDNRADQDGLKYLGNSRDTLLYELLD